MARRRPPKTEDRAARVAAKIEQIAKVSPTAGALFEEWIDRLLAGEPLESVQPEMERLRAILKAPRRKRR